MWNNLKLCQVAGCQFLIIVHHNPIVQYVYHTANIVYVYLVCKYIIHGFSVNAQYNWGLVHLENVALLSVITTVAISLLHAV